MPDKKLMHEICVEFVVDNCRDYCDQWHKCIQESFGYQNGTKKDLENLEGCLNDTRNEQILEVE